MEAYNATTPAIKGPWANISRKSTYIHQIMEKSAYQNKIDEVMGLIGLHVSNSLLFHLDGCDTPKKSWDKLASLFGKINEFRALQLEAEMSSLVPDEHASIEDYLAKFQLFLAQLKGCRKPKSDECIFLILSNLKGSY